MGHELTPRPACLLCPPRRYVHRVGRTGRAGESGTAISLLAPSDAELADELSAMLAASSSGGGGGGGGGDAQQAAATAAAAAAAAESDTDDDEAAAARAAGTSTSGGAAGGLQPHQRLTKAAVEGLRYRAEDVARSITRNVIKEARAKELKNELLNSQRLAAFFEEHPSGKCADLSVGGWAKAASADLPWLRQALSCQV